MDILRLLLEHTQSVSTLQHCTRIAERAREKTVHYCKFNVSAHQVHEIFALLIPEASISESAIDQIYELVDFENPNEPLVPLILDKFEA